MIRALFRTTANLAFLAATMAFLVSVSLFLSGAFLATWPILRHSPRDRRLRAIAELAAAAMAAATAFGSHTRDA